MHAGRLHAMSTTPNTDTRDRLNPADWTINVAGETFPFVEDENGNITGLGHQDKAAFADACNRLEDACGVDIADDERWTEAEVNHAWVTLDEDDDEALHVVDAGTPDAFAVTGLWGHR
jgi:hypothetical protein